jgi:bla regulator protein blaR1
MDWAPDSAMPLSRLTGGTDEAASQGDLQHPSIFTAISEQLGLRLESKKGPVLVFVIEKIARPSEN